MAYTDDTICSAWATEAELLAYCADLAQVASQLPAGTIANALLSASDALYTLSGRIFTGLCVATVKPEYKNCPGERVNLGLWPIHSVMSLTVAGVAVSPTTYTLSGFKYLEFTGEIPAGLVAVVQYGQPPPLLGKEAALALACEFLAAHLGEECSLPSRVTTIVRQGLTQELPDPAALLENERTGVYAADRFLAIYNPTKIPSPAFVISADKVASKHIPIGYDWPYGTRRY